MKLFEDEVLPDNSPLDNIEIKQAILYFSHQEYKEFKALCKRGIRLTYADKSFEDGNISDFLIIFLKQYILQYETDCTKKNNG